MDFLIRRNNIPVCLAHRENLGNKGTYSDLPLGIGCAILSLPNLRTIDIINYKDSNALAKIIGKGPSQRSFNTHHARGRLRFHSSLTNFIHL